MTGAFANNTSSRCLIVLLQTPSLRLSTLLFVSLSQFPQADPSRTEHAPEAPENNQETKKDFGTKTWTVDRFSCLLADRTDQP